MAKVLALPWGAKSVNARVVIGALIIKHVEGKDDRGTIQMISENPYMQFFLGLDSFSSVAVFDPSLFITIRKRLGNDSFDQMNQIVIAKALNIENKGNKNTILPVDNLDGLNQTDNETEVQQTNNELVFQQVINQGICR